MKALRVFGLMLAAASCATTTADSDYDPSANFSSYRTFKIVQGRVLRNGVLVPEQDLAEQRVATALQEQLEQRGLVATEHDPDLLVGFVAGAQRRQEVEAFDDYPIGFDPFVTPLGGYDSDVWVNDYEQGTLVVDLIDARTQRAVWRGVAETESDKIEPKVVQDAAKRIFEIYPPKK